MLEALVPQCLQSYYSRLKEEVERAKIQLELEKAYHQAAEAGLARGYEA